MTAAATLAVPAGHLAGDPARDLARGIAERIGDLRFDRMGEAERDAWLRTFSAIDGAVAAGRSRALAAAVAGYTSAAAFVNMEEYDKGTLEVGKLADLVVLDADPFEVDPMSIRDISVQATVVGGVVEYRA